MIIPIIPMGFQIPCFLFPNSSNPRPANIDSEKQKRKRILVGVPVERMGRGYLWRSAAIGVLKVYIRNPKHAMEKNFICHVRFGEKIEKSERMKPTIPMDIAFPI